MSFWGLRGFVWVGIDLWKNWGLLGQLRPGWIWHPWSKPEVSSFSVPVSSEWVLDVIRYKTELVVALFFSPLASPMAFGNSRARDEIQAKPQLWSTPQLWECWILNPLHQAGNWTYTSAATPAAAVTSQILNLLRHSGNSSWLLLLIRIMYVLCYLTLEMFIHGEHSHNQSRLRYRTFSILQKVSSCPSQVKTPHPTPGNHPSNFCHHLLVLPILELRIMESQNRSSFVSVCFHSTLCL